MKRVVDMVVGVVLGLAALPFIAGLALAGALVWRTNPFFVQERIGRDGRPFRLYKLRSLPPSSPAYADKYEIDGAAVPPFGRWLRRTHLDELPQLAQVITGRMSLVGPRPEMPFLHQRMPSSFAQDRTRIRPGITGLWQISVAVRGLIAEAPGYDRLYLRAGTFRLDLWIMWRTALKLLGTAPISTPDVPAWTRPLEVWPRGAPEPALSGSPADDGLAVILDLTDDADNVVRLPEVEATRSRPATMTREAAASTLFEGRASG